LYIQSKNLILQLRGTDIFSLASNDSFPKSNDFWSKNQETAIGSDIATSSLRRPVIVTLSHNIAVNFFSSDMNIF